MKKALFLLAFALISTLAGVAQSSTKVEIQGNKIVELQTKGDSNFVETQLTYQEKNGDEYPILVREDGRCIIIKISKKTGKEYKRWLDEETCKIVCSKVGKEYTYVKKEKNSSN